MKLVLIKSDKNYGFAEGNNIAIRYSMNQNPDFIWLLNNDTTILADSLSKLVGFMEHNPEFQGVTPQIRYYNHRTHVWNCGGFLTWYGNKNYHFGDTNADQVPREGFEHISFITGCAPFFRTQLFEKIGLLSNRYFFGTEDLEFSQRIEKANHSLACFYESIIYHKVGRSINKSPLISGIYNHYLGVFINMRYRWNNIIWNIWRILYSLYIMKLVYFKHKFTLDMTWQLIKALISNSSKLNKIDHITFENAKKQFSKFE